MSPISILDIEQLVNALPAGEKEVFCRLYSVGTVIGEIHTIPSMLPQLEKQFGSAASVLKQKIVKITNLVTLEGMLYNELRRLRPVSPTSFENVNTRLEQARQSDIFSSPLENTPEDTFGRIKGKYCLTAGNLYKNDAFHGLIIYNDFNPLGYTCEQVADYIDTGWQWAQKVRETSPEAKYFLFYWNCLWRAGASQVHGHAQTMLNTGMHYAKVESLRRAAARYRAEYGSDYFTDLFQAHRSIGCGLERKGIKIFACITPLRSKEAWIISEQLTPGFKEAVGDVLICMRDKLGMNCFNLGLVTPPLARTEEDWNGFPVIARIIDRGDINLPYSDVSSPELFGASIVDTDPFVLAHALLEHLTP